MKALHPKMVAHGQKVKAAHAHLSTLPGFTALAPKVRMQVIQAHIRQGGVK